MAGPLVAGGDFDVVEIDGAAVADGSAPTLSFGLDGRVSGRATVNRLMGSYELHGDVLQLGALATTMMAGPPELMEQERRVLEVLGSGELAVVSGVSREWLRLVAPAGELMLRRSSSDGPDDADGPDGAEAADGTGQV